MCSIYEQDSEQRKYTLRQDIFNLRCAANSDISTHRSKIENLAHKLNTLEQNVDEKMSMTKILVTLPEKYEYFAIGVYVFKWKDTN